MNKSSEHPYKARFPLEVWQQLQRLAAQEERSINWEIVQAVRERVARQQKGSKRRGHTHEVI
jgi:predicted transcriptional regulator